MFPISHQSAGLSPERLSRIRTKMEKHIDAGRLAGGLGLIMRHGQVGYFEAWGMSDREVGTPMREDAVFRIYSMTKAVTGVAAMMLFEEGAFALADPISNFIPEFKEMQVAAEAPDPTGKMVLTGTIPAQRPITVLDLMRHTAGFNYTGPHDERGELLYPQRGLTMMQGGLTSAEFVTPRSPSCGNPEPPGITASERMCSAGWSKCSPASPSRTSSPRASSSRSACPIPIFTSTRETGIGSSPFTSPPRQAPSSA